MKKTIFLMLFLIFPGCDDNSTSNNINNVNNTNNANNINNTNNINNSNNSNNLVCNPVCNEWEECILGECSIKTGRCRATNDCSETNDLCDSTTHNCISQSTWEHFPVTIEDPIVTGSSLMMPEDGITFSYNSEESTFITSFSRDYDNPAITFLWKVDENLNTTKKFMLSGDIFPENENFCMDESWCQFIGFDPQNHNTVIIGPKTTSYMSVDSSGISVLTPVTGVQPANGNISYSHLFDWENRKIYVFGFMGPSQFATSLYIFDFSSASWSETQTGLTEIGDNCLAFDSLNNTLYSIGGRTSNDGGNSYHETDLITSINLTSNTVNETQLPAEIGSRSSMSCVFVPQLSSILVFGGTVINDRWNEIQNEYHNDLWAYNVNNSTWTNIFADGVLGSFDPPDTHGDQAFVGNPDKPNFGQNRGLMKYDNSNSRLIIAGSVPIFTHEQFYFMDIDWIRLFLEQ